MTEPHSTLAWLFGTGIVAGVGKMLASEDKLTVKLVLGRAITSGVLGVASASTLLVFPDMPFTAQVGVACTVSSLGASFLEQIAKKAFRL